MEPNVAKIQHARDSIEDAFWALMNEGWTDEQIKDEADVLLAGCRDDLMNDENGSA